MCVCVSVSVSLDLWFDEVLSFEPGAPVDSKAPSERLCQGTVSFGCPAGVVVWEVVCLLPVGDEERSCV